MQAYVINLDESVDRWCSVQSAFSDMGLEISRISAVHGKSINWKGFVDQSRAFKTIGREIQAGEVGCFLSHQKVLELFVQSGEEWCLVIEDDAIPGVDFEAKLSELIDFFENDCDVCPAVVNLGPSDYRYTSAIRCTTHGLTILSAHRFPVLTTGLLWSRSGAIAALNRLSGQLVFLPFDNMLRMLMQGGSEGFSVRPPLVTAANFDSVIEVSNFHQKRSRVGRIRFYHLIKARRLLMERLHAILSMIRWRLR